MEYRRIDSFPSQRVRFGSKTKNWRKKCVDWADNRSYMTSELVRKTVYNKKINYDLLRGILHMPDLELIINPDNIHAGYIPERIQHYPIMNSKLNVLKGEEAARGFNYRVIVTNPTSISEIEKTKQQEVFARLQQLIADNSLSDEDFQRKMEEMGDYFTYQWQDTRELRANYLINHYSKEQDFPLIFNDGFWDAMAVSEEIYQCDIVGGEPVLERLNNLITRIYRSGNSPKIEDADVIAIEDYWSLGKIIDRYYDELSAKDIKHLEELAFSTGTVVDEMDNIDPRSGLVRAVTLDLNAVDGLFDTYHDSAYSQLPYDANGNIRVFRVYWKSLRAIKRVKSYNLQTGEEEFNFYDDTYVINKDLGEEEELFWINQAWEGTKIGDNIYVNMRPRPVQYNTMGNISRCHFGIVGTIYTMNGETPYSLVDMMKPYNYLYDVIHDRLVKTIANNWGTIMELDLAQVPEGWDIEKWMYFAKVNKISVKDSFKEGNKGKAIGTPAGAYANNSRGLLSTNDGNFIQQMVNLLEFIKQEMGEVSGINRQREGQVQNRETVGGIERATLQSAHITEWLFTKHSDTKRRVLECFLETAKIALKGTNKKFAYILPDNSRILVDIDGDEFAENDYGLVVDDSDNTEAFRQKLDSLAQAALQNQTLSFSTVMKLWSSCSMAEKTRMIEKDEQAAMQRAQQAQQEQMQQEMQLAQMQQQQQAAELEAKDAMNMRDNETKIVVATISAQGGQEDGIQEPESQLDRDKLQESIRQFDERLRLDRDKLNADTRLREKDLSIKSKKANQPKSSSK